MKPVMVHIDAVTPHAWRNGGGQTRELLRWPADADTPWQLRISLADIDSNGPFSAFENVDRWFAVVEGAGVVLSFADDKKRLSKASPPLRFEGGAPPQCELIDGPTRDLNLMLQNGSGQMQTALDRLAWRPAAAQCGLFTTVAGYIHVGSKPIGPIGPIAAQSLVWFDEVLPAPLIFEALQHSHQPVGWWMSFTPREQLQ